MCNCCLRGKKNINVFVHRSNSKHKSIKNIPNALGNGENILNRHQPKKHRNIRRHAVVNIFVNVSTMYFGNKEF